MKIDEYMKLPYKIEIIPDLKEGGYTISFPELPGCVSCAESLQEAYIMAEDAKRSWLEAALESNLEIPTPINYDDYPNQFKLRMPKSLYKKLYEKAKLEGVSMNQYCVHLLSSYV